MTAKEYLQQIEKLDCMIDSKQEELRQLNELATSIASSATAERVQSSSTKDRTGETVAKIVDLQNEINKDIDKFVNFRHNAKKFIECLNMPYYQIIELKYFQYRKYRTWKDIAEKMNYNEDYIKRLHGQALFILNNITKSRNVMECHMQPMV